MPDIRQGVVQLAQFGLQLAGAGQGREEIIALFHALVIADGLNGVFGLLFYLAQVVIGFVGVVALFGQAGELFPGQVRLLVFKGHQGVGQPQPRGVRIAFYQPGEFVLGGLQLAFVDQHAAVQGAHLPVGRETPGGGGHVIQGVAVLPGLIQQVTFQDDGRLELRFSIEQGVQLFQCGLRLAGDFLEQGNAVFQFGGFRVPFGQVLVQSQQFLLLCGWQSGGHGGQAVEVGIFTLVHNLLHMEQGGFQVLALYCLNGRYPVCLQVVRINIQPESGQLLLGVVCIEGLGNPHGPVDHCGVFRGLGRLQVIHQGYVIAATLCGNFCGKQLVQHFRFKVGVPDFFRFSLLGLNRRCRFFGGSGKTGAARQDSYGKTQQAGNQVRCGFVHAISCVFQAIFQERPSFRPVN